MTSVFGRKLPANWKAKPMKRVARFVSGGTPSKANDQFWAGSVPWFSPKDFGPVNLVDSQDHISDEAVAASATTKLPAGTPVLVARSGVLKHTIPVGRLAVAACINQDVKGVLLKPEILPEYFVYFVQGFQRELIDEWTKKGATVESIEQEYLDRSTFPVPPVSSQRLICSSLDAKTAAIDALIAKKELLIEELRKYQEAVIAEAVAPREGWTQVRLKQCVSVKISTGVGEPGTQYVEGDPRYIRTSDMSSIFELNPENQRTLPRQIAAGAEVLPGDILFTTAGSVGKTYHHSTPGDFCYAGFLARVRLKEAHHSRFFAYLLASSKVQELVAQFKVTSTIDNFSASKLGEIEVAVPGKPEQERLAAGLTATLAASSAALTVAGQSLAALRELRSAVISEAVTGKSLNP